MKRIFIPTLLLAALAIAPMVTPAKAATDSHTHAFLIECYNAPTCQKLIDASPMTTKAFVAFVKAHHKTDIAVIESTLEGGAQTTTISTEIDHPMGNLQSDDPKHLLHLTTPSGIRFEIESKNDGYTIVGTVSVVAGKTPQQLPVTNSTIVQSAGVQVATGHADVGASIGNVLLVLAKP